VRGYLAYPRIFFFLTSRSAEGIGNGLRRGEIGMGEQLQVVKGSADLDFVSGLVLDVRKELVIGFRESGSPWECVRRPGR